MKYYERNFIYRIRKIGSKVLLMSTKDCFEINEITKDIFEFLEEKKNEQDIINYLKSVYSNVDENEIKEFLDNGKKVGIIELCQI